MHRSPAMLTAALLAASDASRAYALALEAERLARAAYLAGPTDATLDASRAASRASADASHALELASAALQAARRAL